MGGNRLADDHHPRSNLPGPPGTEPPSPTETICIDTDGCLLVSQIVLTPDVTTYPPGESVFQFSFELPATLPSSFLLKDVYSGKIERLHAEIKYVATVWLTVADRPSVTYLSATETFVVHAPHHLDPPVRAFEVSMSERIRFMCCFRRGGLHVTAATPQDVYAAGEAIQLQCRVDNTASKTPIKRVTVTLIQELVAHNVDVGAGLVVHRTIAKQEYTGPAEGRAWDQRVTINTYDCKTDQSRRDVLAAVQPEPTQPGVDANFFKCSYHLVVKCKPLASRSIVTELPVRILHRATFTGPASIVVKMDKPQL